MVIITCPKNSSTYAYDSLVYSGKFSNQFNIYGRTLLINDYQNSQLCLNPKIKSLTLILMVNASKRVLKISALRD